jgi:hypothetical protein
LTASKRNRLLWFSIQAFPFRGTSRDLQGRSHRNWYASAIFVGCCQSPRKDTSIVLTSRNRYGRRVSPALQRIPWSQHRPHALGSQWPPCLHYSIPYHG